MNVIGARIPITRLAGILCVRSSPQKSLATSPTLELQETNRPTMVSASLPRYYSWPQSWTSLTWSCRTSSMRRSTFSSGSGSCSSSRSPSSLSSTGKQIYSSVYNQYLGSAPSSLRSFVSSCSSKRWVVSMAERRSLFSVSRSVTSTTRTSGSAWSTCSPSAR